MKDAMAGNTAIKIIRPLVITLVLGLIHNSLYAITQGQIKSGDCPPIAFVKRQHFDRPFGIGSMIGWDIYKPGGGIYVYDPTHPRKEPREIFRRDDGVIFDMSASFDAKKLLFSWKKCKQKNRQGPLTVSHVWRDDTINLILDSSSPTRSSQKPNHSFWTRKGGMEWAQVNFTKPQNLSRTTVYWFDDQPNGGCAVPESWKLLYKKNNKWQPVEINTEFATTKDTYITRL